MYNDGIHAILYSSVPLFPGEIRFYATIEGHT